MGRYRFGRIHAPDRFGHRSLGGLFVRGRIEPIRVVEIFAGDDARDVALKQRARPEFEAGPRGQADGDPVAVRAHFDQVLVMHPTDRVAHYLLDQLGRRASAS